MIVDVFSLTETLIKVRPRKKPDSPSAPKGAGHVLGDLESLVA